MNKAILDGAKGKCLLLSLEPGNLHKLKLGQPIEFSLNDHDLFPYGLPAKLAIAITYSETPVADAKHMAERAAQVTDRRTAKLDQVRPHCPECRSTIEQLGVQRSDTPVWMIFCTVCGCTLGAIPPQESLKETSKSLTETPTPTVKQ